MTVGGHRGREEEEAMIRKVGIEDALRTTEGNGDRLEIEIEEEKAVIGRKVPDDTPTIKTLEVTVVLQGLREMTDEEARAEVAVVMEAPHGGMIEASKGDREMCQDASTKKTGKRIRPRVF